MKKKKKLEQHKLLLQLLAPPSLFFSSFFVIVVLVAFPNKMVFLALTPSLLLSEDFEYLINRHVLMPWPIALIRFGCAWRRENFSGSVMEIFCLLKDWRSFFLSLHNRGCIQREIDYILCIIIGYGVESVSCNR